MSQQIPSSQFGHGAGKGDEERPVDRLKFRANFAQIRGLGSVTGTQIKKKGGKTTYSYRLSHQTLTRKSQKD
jgi:hypothetical protein